MIIKLLLLFGHQSPTHRMDLQDRGDLSTEEEDAVHGQMKQYEDKIDTLMSHVGTLKNEVCPVNVIGNRGWRET